MGHLLHKALNMSLLFFRFFKADDHSYCDTFAIKLDLLIQVGNRLLVFGFFNLRRDVIIRWLLLTVLDFHLFHLLLEVFYVLTILVEDALIKLQIAHAAWFSIYGLCYLLMDNFRIFNANDFQ